jgi:type IV pilus assembly protein PilO
MHFGFRELIFFAVLLAVPVASYMYVFQPRNDEIAQAQEEIQQKQARLDQLAQVIAKIDDIGLAIESGREAIEMIEAKLPSEQDVEGILEQVWQLAARSQLNVRSVKSERPVPAALYMELPLRVTMEGPFDGFYQFLLELENLPRITRVHQMDLKRADTGPRIAQGEMPPGSTLAEFTLSIYFEPRNPAS